MLLCTQRPLQVDQSMNESSSKYVDQIATEKLLVEKLNRVHHASPLLGDWSLAGFDDFIDLPDLPQQVQETREGENILLRFPSAQVTPFAENNQVVCHIYPAEAPQGELIFVHGLYEDSLVIYNYFISLLCGLGIQVTLLELPYHYRRTPAASQFSGEYFWSGDLLRSACAHKQAVYDLFQAYNLRRKSSPGPLGIAGFSMGGGIALSLAARIPLPCVFLINPVCNISELVWSSTLFAPIRKDLEAQGIDFGELKARYRTYEPLDVAAPQTQAQQMTLAHSLYDQINDPGNYDLLIHHWGITNVLPYKAGHLNILRVPRLANDVAQALLQPERNLVSTLEQGERE